MPRLFVSADKKIDGLFIEVTAAKGSKVTSANPAPMNKSDKRVSWVADICPSNKYTKENYQKKRVRDRAEEDVLPDSTKSMCTLEEERFLSPPPQFDPNDDKQAFITAPAKITVPLPSSEIVTSDRMHITTDKLVYETIGPGEGSHNKCESSMIPPMRYHAPTFPPVGPPVVGECFQVASCDLRNFLKKSLTTLMLSRPQARSMMRYWLPSMQEYPWCLVKFLPDIDTIEHVVGKITLLPEPASLRRVFMVWQGMQQRVQDTPFSPMHHDRFDGKFGAGGIQAAPPEPQNLVAIADACICIYPQPDWPPKEDPSLTPAMKAEHPDYGYVQQASGLWAYTLIVDEEKKPAILDIVEFGGACLNDITPDKYSLEMFKVTRV